MHSATASDDQSELLLLTKLPPAERELVLWLLQLLHDASVPAAGAVSSPHGSPHAALSSAFRQLAPRLLMPRAGARSLVPPTPALALASPPCRRPAPAPPSRAHVPPATTPPSHEPAPPPFGPPLLPVAGRAALHDDSDKELVFGHDACRFLERLLNAYSLLLIDSLLAPPSLSLSMHALPLELEIGRAHV